MKGSNEAHVCSVPFWRPAGIPLPSHVTLLKEACSFIQAIFPCACALLLWLHCRGRPPQFSCPVLSFSLAAFHTEAVLSLVFPFPPFHLVSP